ncbi:E3 ubiquitin-protein ligase TRIM45-like [Saccostrea cucullata]|uniref:E3 ubiquitin-protein ligase TRIM45-like n=1 Tax=Saccostrea cuccullata TaxID=36930 RepID=UPI002ED11ABA
MDQVPDTAQHVIECDTESCGKFSEFYCNTCHQRICDQCKQRHLEQNKGHEIVRYHKRKRKLPSEKCMIHPTQDIDIFCKVCEDPLCSTCFALFHSDHDKSDLETIYNDILQQCQKEIAEIWKTVIPKAKNNLESKRDNVTKEIAKIRVSMKKRADEVKKVVDSILTDNNKKLDEIENSILDEILEHQRETEGYINYLEKMIADYESKMSSIKHTELMKFNLDISLSTLKMPSKSEPKLPIFTLGTLNKEEIAKQLGKIELEIFKLSSITKVSEKTIQRDGTSHLSLSSPNKFWASDGFRNLIQYDMEGKILHKDPPVFGTYEV